MKKITRKQIEAELAKGTKKPPPKRWGVEYGRYNAYALDAGIRTRQYQAKRWREKLLEVMGEHGVGELDAMKARIKLDGYRYSWRGVAYFVAGKLVAIRKGQTVTTTGLDMYTTTER